MAPPTVPTEIKRKRGTLRKDRTPGPLVPIVGAGVVPPPSSLRDAGAYEWKHALEVCSWIAKSDLTCLRLMCEAIDRHDELREKLVGADLMLETSTGYLYVNPIVGAIDKLQDRIADWMSKLGMTPSARAQLGVAEVKTASTLDKLAARRKQRQVPSTV